MSGDVVAAMGGTWRERWPVLDRAMATAGRLGTQLRHGLAEVGLHGLLAVERGIRHVAGPEPPPPGPREAVATCLVRDGMPWLSSYLDHYRGLGVRHLIFLDNGSEDGTVERLAGEPDVTVYASDLPFRFCKVPFKRWLVRRFGRGGWCLYTDVDELFDYPFSDSIPLDAFLGYLNDRRFDAVVAYILDMFGREPLNAIQGRPAADVRERYRWFERTAVWEDEDAAWLRENHLSLEVPAYRGGVRGRAFGLSGTLLTKHPLIRYRPGVQPFPYSDHFVAGARIADVTGVIRHYKFASALFEQIHRAVEERQYHAASRKYRRFASVLKRREDLSLWTPAAEEFRSAEALMREGFLPASKEFRRWAEARREVATA